MTKQINEKLSAFVDGELEAAEADRLISDILANDELRSHWANYHSISHSLNGQSANSEVDLSVSISAALANEPTVFAPQHKKRIFPAAFKQAAGMAIAATVAAVAVLMVQPEEQNLFNPGAVANAPTISSPIANQNVLPVAVNGVNWSVAEPSVASKLNAYLVNHNGYSTPVRGAMPFAQIVSYGNKHSVKTDDSVVLEYNPNGSSVRR